METKLDHILSKRPNVQIADADTHIRSYIEILEGNLKEVNKSTETKCLDLQQKLFSLNLQLKKCAQQDVYLKKVIQQIQANNIKLDSENKQLKLQVSTLQSKIENRQNKRCDELKKITPSCSSNTTERIVGQLNRTDDDNDSNANSVLVKGFSELQLNAIPKINIINLGRHMNLKITESDIVQVSMMERKFYVKHNLKPNKVILIVQFRTAELKVEFLKNKEKLKLQANLSDIDISDYVSDNVYNLYQYAKILKTHGYELVYWRNNCVYVKKTRSTYCEPILINSKNQVDNLKIVKKI